jgi:FixJ family two-component response regulator
MTRLLRLLARDDDEVEASTRSRTHDARTPSIPLSGDQSVFPRRKGEITDSRDARARLDRYAARLRRRRIRKETDMTLVTAIDDGRATTGRAAAATPIVFVVHDDASVRDSLALLIQAAGWHAKTFASAQAFLMQPPAEVPSCLILDVTRPSYNGLNLQKRVAVERPQVPIIFTTRDCDVATSVQAMKAGAFEFLTRPFSDDDFVDAMRGALERSRRILERDAKMRTVRESYASLTPREREVMVLVVSGLLNKQVGGELGISEITVKAHRGQVMRKMKADSLAALVTMVASLGLANASIGW